MSLGTDFRIAVRSLARSPGFALGAMVTMGLGLGAATVITTAGRAALSAAPPFRAPADLVLLRPVWTPTSAAPQELRSWSYPLYTALRDSDPGLPLLAAYTPSP